LRPRLLAGEHRARTTAHPSRPLSGPVLQYISLPRCRQHRSGGRSRHTAFPWLPAPSAPLPPDGRTPA
jgi:hypothetical protein